MKPLTIRIALFLVALLMIAGLSACKKDTAAPAGTQTAESTKADDAKPADDKKAADAQNKDADKKPADAAATLKTTDMKNFKLVIPSNIDTSKFAVSVEKAADGIERSLITGYEGNRTEQPWYIRLAEIGDVMGESCYIFDVAQSDGAEFNATFRGAVSQTRKIYLFEKETGNWINFGSLPEDE